MRKGKSLIGMRVIGEVDGTDLGDVKDLIFDHNTNEALALLMSEKDLFGLIDAQVIPWERITHVGPDAITVNSSDARVKAGDDPRVKKVMGRETALSGTRVYTSEGKDLGTLADTLLDDETGRIEGYEISGGFVSDTMTGKRFLPSDHDLTIGRDVALVEPESGEVLEAQREQEPGGLTAAASTAGDKVTTAYDSARERANEAYANIASASVEKQKEYVIGKKASRDVVIEDSDTVSPTAAEAQTPGAPAADMTSSGEVVTGEVLVREGEIITARHADRAVEAEVLNKLVASAAGAVAGEAFEAGRERVSGAVASGSEQAGTVGSGLQERAESAAIGKVAAREVAAPDGTVIVAEGQVVTQEILETARLHNREREVVAVAGLGAASQGANEFRDSATETASSLWDAAKQKVTELSHSAQEKKEEYDRASEQSKINHALGRPVTRVILDQKDNVVLNTGDIITHAAVDRSREAGVLDVLLDSVYDLEPEITPEMMRAESKGDSALRGQQDPSGGPITATVRPDQPPQAAPSQGDLTGQQQR